MPDLSVFLDSRPASVVTGTVEARLADGAVRVRVLGRTARAASGAGSWPVGARVLLARSPSGGLHVVGLARAASGGPRRVWIDG